MSLPELQSGIDAGSLKALRAARVLRPLKLVSGIPSKSSEHKQGLLAVCRSEQGWFQFVQKTVHC